MYLLDTNVVSELRKIRGGKADPCVAEWADSVEAGDLYLSVMTVHELEVGVLLAERRDPSQGSMFRAWLNGMTVVTRNVTDFAPTGVATLNPWTPSASAI